MTRITRKEQAIADTTPQLLAERQPARDCMYWVPKSIDCCFYAGVLEFPAKVAAGDHSLIADEAGALAPHRVQFDPAVVRLAKQRVVARDRLRLAITTRGHPGRVDALRLEIAPDRLGTTL